MGMYSFFYFHLHKVRQMDAESVYKCQTGVRGRPLWRIIITVRLLKVCVTRIVKSVETAASATDVFVSGVVRPSYIEPSHAPGCSSTSSKVLAMVNPSEREPGVSAFTSLNRFSMNSGVRRYSFFDFHFGRGPRGHLTVRSVSLIRFVPNGLSSRL